VQFLLGKLWTAYGETTKAVECFVEALRTNPFLWDAFTDLCNTGECAVLVGPADHVGARVKVANVFRLTSEMLASLDAQPQTVPQVEPVSQNLPLQPQVNGNIRSVPDPFVSKPRHLDDKIIELDTPDDDVPMDDAPFEDGPPAVARKPRGLYAFNSEISSEIPKMRSITTRSRSKADSDVEEPVRPTSIPVSHKRTISGHVPNMEPPGAPARRSDRLLRSRILPSSARLAAAVSRDPETKEKRDIRKMKAPGARAKAASTVGRVVSGNRKPLEPTGETKDRPASVASTNSVKEIVRKPPPTAPEISPQKEALVFLLDQFARIGQGYLALSKYECQAALGSLDSVYPAFRETPWVLAQIGRAHYEKSAYAEAEQVFAKVKKMAPSRTEDMEIYSTALWHLKKDVDLAYMSHELVEADRLSPQAWCALGNAFSSQGEHDQAVRCFRRATQLDPRFAYAFTLAGHEHVANEEFEKALQAFRRAIAVERRHYNGWYGLGQVFEKLGRYEAAREHYACAARINPTNAILKVCVGFVLEKMAAGAASGGSQRMTPSGRPGREGLREMALGMYREACALEPRSTKARFSKARVLLALQRPKEAFVELDFLKTVAPDFPNVHFLLGKVYKALGERDGALRHYTIAMNLDPKVCPLRAVDLADWQASNVCKEALEALGKNYDDDEEME
jgi:anaphase-promoting complex subunit 3